MERLTETQVYCPYCGEPFTTFVEVLDEDQQYTEDCYVCCRPIVFKMTIAINGDWDLSVYREGETY